MIIGKGDFAVVAVDRQRQLGYRMKFVFLVVAVRGMRIIIMQKQKEILVAMVIQPANSTIGNVVGVTFLMKDLLLLVIFDFIIVE